jgi:hypothetical protein
MLLTPEETLGRSGDLRRREIAGGADDVHTAYHTPQFVHELHPDSAYASASTNSSPHFVQRDQAGSPT